MRLRKGLEGALISLLAQGKPLTFDEIKAGLSRRHLVDRASKAGIYRALGELRKERIVSRRLNRYSLRCEYLHYLTTFSQQALSRIGRERQIAAEREKAPFNYRCSSLTGLDKTLNGVVRGWFNASPGEFAYYQHAPHAWFALAHAGEERLMLQETLQRTRGCYTLVNNATFLDRWIGRFYAVDSSVYRCSKRPSKRLADHYFGVYGDHYFEARYPVAVVRALDRIFDNCESIGDISPFDIVSVFNNPQWYFDVICGNDALHAARLRHNIESRLKSGKVCGPTGIS